MTDAPSVIVPPRRYRRHKGEGRRGARRHGTGHCNDSTPAPAWWRCGNHIKPPSRAEWREIDETARTGNHPGPVYPCGVREIGQRRRYRGSRRGRRKAGQRLQLVRLHRRRHHPEFREAVRHQGHLRRVRQQRGAGDQAAGRQQRLRRGRAHDELPGPADPGGGVPAAGQEQDPQLRQPGPGHHEAPGEPGPGQPARDPLHVGHHRHRLQRGQGEGRVRQHRPRQQPGHRVQAGEHQQAEGLWRDLPRYAVGDHPDRAETIWARIPTATIRP